MQTLWRIWYLYEIYGGILGSIPEIDIFRFHQDAQKICHSFECVSSILPLLYMCFQAIVSSGGCPKKFPPLLYMRFHVFYHSFTCVSMRLYRPGRRTPKKIFYRSFTCVSMNFSSLFLLVGVLTYRNNSVISVACL